MEGSCKCLQVVGAIGRSTKVVDWARPEIIYCQLHAQAPRVLEVLRMLFNCEHGDSWSCPCRDLARAILRKSKGNNDEWHTRLWYAAEEMLELLKVLACIGDNDGPLAEVYRATCERARIIIGNIENEKEG